MIKDALKYLEPNACVPIDMATTSMLVNALKEALAQPEQEPVGSVVRWVDGSLIHGWFGDPPPEGTLLYTHPPRRTEEKNT